MSKLIFPPVETADEDGLIGVSSTFTVEDLLDAYCKGIFPWPWSEDSVAWFAPPKRAVLFLDNLRINRSLKRALQTVNFSIEEDRDFKSIITGCRNSKNRKKQKGTWITNQMVQGYCQLFDAGFAKCFGTYNKTTLVGGLYGVRIGNYFSAESMFYLEPNASKFALIKCIEQLKSDGINWIDCQVINPVTESIGAVEISREQFTTLLTKTILEKI
jgi:leucyl/phenylalanyl-tRNA--protein transferase